MVGLYFVVSEYNYLETDTRSTFSADLDVKSWITVRAASERYGSGIGVNRSFPGTQRFNNMCNVSIVSFICIVTRRRGNWKCTWGMAHIQEDQMSKEEKRKTQPGGLNNKLD